MRNMLKTVCKSVTCLSIIAIATAAFAATDVSRGTATANRGRGTAASRMPSIPILPVSAVGNMTVSVARKQESGQQDDDAGCHDAISPVAMREQEIFLHLIP